MVMQRMSSRIVLLLVLLPLLFLMAGMSRAAEQLKPFELASNAPGELEPAVAKVRQQLVDGGFTIVGSYTPYTNAPFAKGEVVSAEVLAVTSPALQKAAAATPTGGYAAVQRVSVTQVVVDGASQVQVAWTNPSYMAHAYRLTGDLADVTEALGKALGAQQAYGSERGLTAAALERYHYKAFMPYFTDADLLASYDTHEQAVNAVQAGLAAHRGGTTEVYRLAVPGTQQTVFGVALSGPEANACSGDQYIMSRIDFQPIKSTAHLPYDVLVADNKVYALAAKFRIAINFPDLSMMGSHSFVSIMCAPGSIKKALTEAARGG